MTASRSVSDASHRTALNDRYARGMQRGLDVAIAGAALSFFALLLPLLALAIKLDSRGPVYYSRTRTGRFLRRSRLDEVPQFWNVLRGEMSVVGPRPERLCFINQFEQDVPFYRERLLVRPGITGLAQIENGYDCDLESVRRKVALDRRYICEIGLWTDVRILARTVRVVWRGSGAH